MISTEMTVEQRDARIKELHDQLVELQPVVQLLREQLKLQEAKVSKLYKEKWELERLNIKVTVCRTGQSGRTVCTTKEVDIESMLKNMDNAKIEKLLEAMQSRLAKEENK